MLRTGVYTNRLCPIAYGSAQNRQITQLPKNFVILSTTFICLQHWKTLKADYEHNKRHTEITKC